MRQQETSISAGLRAPWQIAECPKDTPVLLALSGGADSRYLLHCLAEMATRDGFSLTLAHVNHGIRGAEAIRDRDFCGTLAEEYGLELCVLNADVPALAASNGRGLEEEAREVRYRYFSELMKARAIPLLVTAHNADDNAETVLFRMARGSGLSGLCGIAPVRPFEGGFLIRPMLSLTKGEILMRCERLGLTYVTDSTNIDTVYARNRLRAEVLPVLDTLFSGAGERISKMCETLREDEALLSSLARDAYKRICTRERCEIEGLLANPPAIRHRVLSLWGEEIGAGVIERVHLDALLRLAEVGEAHRRADLPRGISVAREDGYLCVADQTTPEPVAYRLPFSEGVVAIPNSNLRISVEKFEKKRKVHNLSTAPYIILTKNFDIMKNELYWRPRREGDRLLMGGMHRPVRKLYREARLPLSERAALPLLCDGEGIVWVPHVGVRDGVETATDGIIVTLLTCGSIE